MLLFFFALLFGFSSPRFFVMVATPIYNVVNYASKQFGYEFRCYDIHGGFDCEFVKPLPTDAEVKQQNDALMNQFRCQTDSDCVLTDNGACGLKGIVSGRSSDGACVCANGSVISGCFPKGSSLLEAPPSSP